MRPCWAVFAFFCVGAANLAVAQPIGPGPGPKDAAIQRGETLVRRQCGGCHAVERTGRSPLAAAPPLRDLHKRYEPEVLGEALAEGILTGHPAMPEFRFPPNDVRAVILYLESIQTRQRF